jgi:large subunit ribosomal protein L4
VSDAPQARRPHPGAVEAPPAGSRPAASGAALEVLAYGADGTRRPRAVRLPAEPFDGTVHEAAMHQAVTTWLANQRQGTAQTKTRSFVTGGNQKPWRQKGTGRARQGSSRSPLWPGGGTTFGPLPRDYRRGIPRKVRRLARRSALNARAREHAISVIAPLTFEAPKTRRVAELLDRLGLGGERRVLVLTHELNANLLLSARNLGRVAVMRYADASAYDILRAHALVIEEPALGTLEPGAAAETIAPPPERVKKKKAPRAEAAAAPAARKGRQAPAKKPAPARKAAPKAAKPARGEAKKPAAKKPAAAPKVKTPAKAAETKKSKPGKKPGKKKKE